MTAGERAAAYWFCDGLPELVFGVALFLLGGIGLAWKLYFPNRWLMAAFVLAGLVFFGLFIWDRKVIGALKARITYPRTGYVEPPREGYPEGRAVLTLRSGSMVSAKQNMYSFRMGVIYFFVIAPNMLGLMQSRWELAVGMIVLATLVYGTRQWSERPYAWWSIVPLALSGLAFSAAGLPMKAQPIAPVLLGGVWLICIGGSRLFHYLRANPLATPLANPQVNPRAR